MKKLILVIILLFILFLKQSYSEPDYLILNSSERSFEEGELSFKTNEDYNLLRGILPSAQVYFNIIPEVPVALTIETKTKESSKELFTSKTKIILKRSVKMGSVFCRYNSTFIHIYLRTACFRL